MERIISLDLETGGLDPQKHSVLSIGAVDLETHKSFHEYLAHEEFVVTADSLDINQIDIRQKRCNAPGVVLYNFMRWLGSIGSDSKYKFLGFNVGSFDQKFLTKLCHDYGFAHMNNRFSYRCIDLNSIICFVKVKRYRNWSFMAFKKLIMDMATNRLNNDKPDIASRGLHDALYDAWLNIYCYEECLRF